MGNNVIYSCVTHCPRQSCIDYEYLDKVDYSGDPRIVYYMDGLPADICLCGSIVGILTRVSRNTATSVWKYRVLGDHNSYPRNVPYPRFCVEIVHLQSIDN